jgi:hypothetical protein
MLRGNWLKLSLLIGGALCWPTISWAGWQNVFQVTCFHRSTPVVAQAPPGGGQSCTDRRLRSAGAAAGLHHPLCPALLLPARNFLPSPDLLRAGDQLPHLVLLRAGGVVPLQLLLRSMYLHVPAGSHAGNFLSVACLLHAGYELGTAVRICAGDHLSSMLLSATGNDLLLCGPVYGNRSGAACNPGNAPPADCTGPKRPGVPFPRREWQPSVSANLSPHTDSAGGKHTGASANVLASTSTATGPEPTHCAASGSHRPGKSQRLTGCHRWSTAAA